MTNMTCSMVNCGSSNYEMDEDPKPRQTPCSDKRTRPAKDLGASHAGSKRRDWVQI
ncbi:hypothetical protein MGG_16624 [Pyricularia oryzae 70-15]|uniref:Uncharacterized protein n=1 Tax=Pyricularia oryzae (strain 70-15 / ATCC MYA-4617 / FGSC 8958) TaxID=242507 RepID=G4N0R3_PYRO7|nr:uncharacterized protein MGG_16624 [Pyricularia oryzae 70-15]EHA51496.1 hypothetical protein MGG_16624 [Pyricularia oryzae 70-15]